MILNLLIELVIRSSMESDCPIVIHNKKRSINLFDMIFIDRRWIRFIRKGQMPKISEEKRQARRDQILAASWRCFSRKGIHSTSMEDIVREASLSFGAVYLYYTSKDELILAAFTSALQEMRALLAPIFVADVPYSPPVFVREVAKIISTHASRDGLNFGVAFLMGWSEAQSNPKLKEIIVSGQLAYREAVTVVVRKWQKRGDLPAKGRPEDISKVLLSFFLGFIVQSAMLGAIDSGTAVKGYEGMFMGAPLPRKTGK
jgi:TetR/AcrR family transcriptional regulator, transcriptional repressor of aconitase